MSLDQELFAGVTPTPRANDPQALALLTVRALMAAGLSPPFGADLDDMARVWGGGLAGKDVIAVGEATREWTRGGTTFPTLAEFTDLVDQIARRHPPARNANASRTARVACDFCGGSGWGEGEPDEKNGTTYSTVIPCEVCNPKRWEWWRDGHSNAGHDRGSCDHELCGSAGSHHGRRVR